MASGLAPYFNRHLIIPGDPSCAAAAKGVDPLNDVWFASASPCTEVHARAAPLSCVGLDSNYTSILTFSCLRLWIMSTCRTHTT